jgi:hypothetical protein
MPYFKTCPLCGANNDPGERCDCETLNAALTAGGVAAAENGKSQQGQSKSVRTDFITKGE